MLTLFVSVKHKHHYPQQGDAVMSMSPAKSPGKNSRGFSFTNLNTSQNNETRHNASQHNPHAMRSSLTLNNSTLYAYFAIGFDL